MHFDDLYFPFAGRKIADPLHSNLTEMFASIGNCSAADTTIDLVWVLCQTFVFDAYSKYHILFTKNVTDIRNFEVNLMCSILKLSEAMI